MSNSTKFFLLALLTFSLFAVSGCNTVKGVGKDFENLGESMQNASD